jgi:hypothetical protein
MRSGQIELNGRRVSGISLMIISRYEALRRNAPELFKALSMRQRRLGKDHMP